MEAVICRYDIKSCQAQSLYPDFHCSRAEAGTMAKKLFDRLCKDCECWYGNEDEEYGPCTVKHRRGDKRYVTHGSHKCDEVVEDDQQAPCKG